jgi:hypothetical protein
MLGCVSGFFMGVTVASLRRPTCRELMRDNAPRQPTFAELLIPGEQRTMPITPKPDIVPKPQFPPPRLIREDFLP